MRTKMIMIKRSPLRKFEFASSEQSLSILDFVFQLEKFEFPQKLPPTAALLQYILDSFLVNRWDFNDFFYQLKQLITLLHGEDFILP